MSIHNAKKNVIPKIMVYSVLIIICIWSLFPIYWLVNTSLKNRAEVVTSPPHFLPRDPTIENYSDAWNILLNPYLRNSFIVAIISTAIVVLLGSLASFGFSRFQFKGKNSLFFWIISTRMFPPVVIAIPFFLLLNTLHLVDTYAGLVIAYVSMNLPLSIWILKSFFDDLPKEIEEAALVDGCSMIQTFFRIAFPLAIPGVIACFILSFIFSWNEFLLALVLTRRVAVTAPIALSALETTGGIYWGRVGSYSVFTILPVIVLYFIVQRNLVKGLTLGAIK